MSGYFMLLPLEFNEEEAHVYKVLYRRANFKTMEVKYTLQTLEMDCHPMFNLTKMKLRKILKYFIENNYLLELQKGSKGNPTLYKIISLNKRYEHLNSTNTTQIQHKYMAKTQALEGVTNTNRTGIEHTNNTPYYNKNKYNNNYGNNGQASSSNKGVVKYDYGY